KILTIIDSPPRKIQATSTSAAFPIELRQGMEQRSAAPFYADSDVSAILSGPEWRAPMAMHPGDCMGFDRTWRFQIDRSGRTSCLESRRFGPSFPPNLHNHFCLQGSRPFPNGMHAGTRAKEGRVS